MEVDERIATDAPDKYTAAPDATAIQGSNENSPQQGMEMALQGEAGLERSILGNVRALKVTSGNVTKRLGTRRETQVTTQASKNAAATIQQIVTPERHAEKSRMQE